MSTKTKAPSKNAKIDKAGEELRKLKAEAAAAKKAPAKKPVVKTVTDNAPAIIPPIGNDAQLAILKSHVTIAPDGRTVAGITDDTTKEEAFEIFDAFNSLSECWQIVLGSALHHLSNLSAFGSEEAFAAAMAKSGRGISSLQKYRRAFEQSTPEVLALGLPYTATSKIGKVKDVEKKNALAAKIAEAKESGEPMTVEKIIKEADKLQPKKAKTSPAEVKLNAEEKSMLRQLEELLEPPCEYIGKMGEFDKILASAPKDDTEKLRGLLKTLVKFAGRTEK